jgi:hypothetical protein
VKIGFKVFTHVRTAGKIGTKMFFKRKEKTWFSRSKKENGLGLWFRTVPLLRETTKV